MGALLGHSNTVSDRGRCSTTRCVCVACASPAKAPTHRAPLPPIYSYIARLRAARERGTHAGRRQLGSLECRLHSLVRPHLGPAARRERRRPAARLHASRARGQRERQ
eukprot:scaffold92499_cov63-Phaeocystis_antarctica.AAC.2